MKGTQSEGLNFWTYVGAYAVALALIIWTYAEPNFYGRYVEGYPYVFFIAYIFPWLCIAMFTLHVLNVKGIVSFGWLNRFLLRIFNRKRK